MVKNTDVVATKEITFNVVANNGSNLTYEVADIPTLYKAGADFGTADTIDSDDVDAGYAKEVQITATDATGKSYEIPASEIISVNSDNAALIVGKVNGKYYVASGSDSITEDVTANLNILINTDEGVKSIQKAVTVSAADLKVSKIKIQDKPIGDPTAVPVTTIAFADLADFETGKDVVVVLEDQFGGTSLSADLAAAGVEHSIAGLSGITLGDDDTITFDGSKLYLDDADDDDDATATDGAKFRLVVYKGDKAATINVTITNGSQI